MADFQQSAATREALRRAVHAYLEQSILNSASKVLAAQLGVTVRTINRWKAFIRGTPAQKRAPNLPRVAASLGPVEMYLDAIITVGGDPKYRRARRGIRVEVDKRLFQDALSDPDEAWQDFFDSYVMPSGEIEAPVIRFE